MSKFKLYLLDTGLFVAMLFNNGTNEYEDIYNKLLSNSINTNLGYLYENVVAQMLVAESKKLFYYTWKKPNSIHHFEIDFLYTSKSKVIPLEVKSNSIHNHKSIDEFKKKYSKICGPMYLISAKDYCKSDNLTNIPYYLFPLLLSDKKKS